MPVFGDYPKFSARLMSRCLCYLTIGGIYSANPHLEVQVHDSHNLQTYRLYNAMQVMYGNDGDGGT